VFSQAGSGTTFKIYLPVSVSTETEVVSKQSAPPSRLDRVISFCWSKTELALREITKELLESFNYRVLTPPMERKP